MRLWRTIRTDLSVNERDPKAKTILVLFRLAHFGRTTNRFTRIASLPYIVGYRILVEGILGVELRPRTKIGPGLTIYHGIGTVINDGAIIGSFVTLRHGITIGQAKPGGPSPQIGDHVDIGAGAIILGGVSIGSHAKIGAGAIVVRDVPPHGVARAKPAEIFDPRNESNPL